MVKEEKKMDRLAIFFGTGYEEIEALTVVDILRRAGVEIKMVSITGQRQVTGSHGICVEMDQLLEETDFSQLTGIVLPGGMPGTKNLEACEALMEQVDNFVKEQRLVAAICAAPSILGHRGHLQGKNACIFPGMEEHLKGAKVVMDMPAVADGRIITGRGMGAAIPFGLKIQELLLGRDSAEEMAERIVFKGVF